MMSIRIKRFAEVNAWTSAAYELFRLNAGQDHGNMNAIVLPGGETPNGVFARIAAGRPVCGSFFRVMLSDERYVSVDSSASNFGGMQGMLVGLGLDPDRVLRPDVSLNLQDAADRYDADLRAFFARRGELSVAFLGVGGDGHTASLFSDSDLIGMSDRLAVAVDRPDGMQAVSVTPKFIRAAKKLVFLVKGREKSKIVDALETRPESTVAGRIVKSMSDVELWFCVE